MAQNLSERERQVLDLAAKGHIDESIAQQLQISVATVRGYWLRVRSKLGGSSRAELVGKWVQQTSEDSRLRAAGRHIQDFANVEQATDDAIALERDEMDKILAGLSSAKRKQVEALRRQTDDSRRAARVTESGERKTRA